MQFYPSGTRIAGRYEVAGRPLIGGMGIVYLCFDHEDQRPVALKTFKPEYLSDGAARDRFLQEGDAWTRLSNHPHVVRCYEVFRNKPRPEVFLVLEFVAKEEGRRDASLRSWLTSGTPLPVDQALLIVLQIVRGMSHAAEVIPGFVHRDLKPENVLVGADHLSNAAINRVRVTDFGLAKGLRADQVPSASDLASKPDRLTQMGSVVGTPLYMAPEQWAGADVTVQADIYALGCIMGEIVTGRPMVQGRTLEELRQAHQGGQALAAARVAPAILIDLLNRCLAPDPAQRYASWGALEVALAAAYRTATGQPPPGPETTAALSRAERVAGGWSYSAMGDSYRQMGNAQAALDCFERARQAGQAEGELRLAGVGLSGLGIAYGQLGDGQRASGYFEQALAIARDMGNRGDESSALQNLGNVQWLLRNTRRAISYFEQALSIARKIGDRGGEGNNLSNLGMAHVELGDIQQAIGYFEQALSLAREIGDHSGEGTILTNLGEACRRLGDLKRAIRYFEQALMIHRGIGDLNGVAGTSLNMALLYDEQGDRPRALALAQKAASLFAQMGHAAYAQQAQKLVAELAEGGAPTSSDPNPDEILSRLTSVIVSSVAAARGDHTAKARLEQVFPMLTQNGWQIAEPIRRIWAGEREATKLAADLDERDSLIVREILRWL